MATTIEQQHHEIIEQLHHAILEVKFTKADGSIRVLVGTLKDNLLPPQPVVEEGTIIPISPYNPELVKVYDLEASAWRSFKTQNVISWRILEELQ